MTDAVVLAFVPGSEGVAALLDLGEGTLLRRNVEQLREAGVDRVTVVTTEPAATACRDAIEGVRSTDVLGVKDLPGVMLEVARLCAAAAGRVVVVDGAILTHLGTYTGLLRHPRIASGVLISSSEDGWPVRVERGRVVSVSSPFHHVTDPTGSLSGMLVVAPPDAKILVDKAAQIAELLRADRMPTAWHHALERTTLAWADRGQPPVGVPGAVKTHPDKAALRAAAALDPLPLLALALVRGDALVRCAYVRQLFWARPLSHQQVEDASRVMATVDEERVLMNSAVKVNDGFFGTFFCSPYTKYIARWFAKLGISPNQVTVLSFLLGLASAAAFSRGTFVARVVGAILLYLTLAFDCVDGQLARYSRRFTALGAWLDPMFDRAKEYSVYAALAYGAVLTGADPNDAWLLASATLALQTVRHHMDFAFAAGQNQVIASARKAPLEEPWDQPSRVSDSLAAPADEAQDESAETHDLRPGSASGGAIQRILNMSHEANRLRWVVWTKRIIQFPIGERYAAICFAAVLGGANTVFAVMLIWGAFSMLYMTTGRIMRTAR